MRPSRPFVLLLRRSESPSPTGQFRFKKKNETQTPERKKDIAVSAFEQMELQLATKRQKKTSVMNVDGEVVPTTSSSNTKPSKKQVDLNAGALLEAIDWAVFSRR